MSQLKKVDFGVREFLELIWPNEGHYCIALPFTIPDSGVQTYTHKVFDDIDDAIRFVKRERKSKNVFYAVHSLAERSVWNDKKKNYKTGKMGAPQVRVQRNMLKSKAFYLDIDIGDADGKYSTQAEGAKALIEFCKTTHLPKPYVVVSGSGLHVYWVLDTAITSQEWVHHAQKLGKLAEVHGLQVDPARTADTASVLRPVGTHNLKDAANPLEVYVAVRGTTTPTDTLTTLIDKALIRTGEQVAAPRVKQTLDDLGPRPTNLGILKGNIDAPTETLVSFKALVAACGQMRHAVENRKTLEQPHWYGALGLMPYVEKGETYAHKISRDHEDYSEADTDAKYHQWESAATGPTTCQFFQSKCASRSICEACPHKGSVGSPVVAARRTEQAPPPVVEVADTNSVTGKTITMEIPQPPKPYIRLKSGGVATEVSTSDGEVIQVKFLDYDLYPVRRIVNEKTKVEQQVWAVDLPRRGHKEFTIDATAVYDSRKFAEAIVNVGIYFDPANFKYMQGYMISYITQLQKTDDAEEQIDHLGWDNIDMETFYLPEKAVLRGGKSRPIRLTEQAESVVEHVHTHGTLPAQVELLKFYDRPEYIAHQFFIGAGLGSVLFAFTGHAGSVINAYGEAGSSKSTALYAAASFWGQPEQYPLNGTQHGITPKARLQRTHVFANYPTCVDEITHMSASAATEMAMAVTQQSGPIKLTKESTEKKQIKSFKSAFLMSTSNASVHNMLSMDNSAGTAGSMRVVEIWMRAQIVHQKHEADEFMYHLRRNYGHIGPRFVEIVMRNRDKVEALVKYWTRRVDEAGRIAQSERFWSSSAGAILAAILIANKAGLISYDVEKLFNWFIQSQLPAMRNIVNEEYSTPLSILTDYMEQNHDHIIVTRESVSSTGMDSVIRAPRGNMVGHYDMDRKLMWLLKKPFKEYNVHIGANSNKVTTDLSVKSFTGQGAPAPIVLRRNCKKILGANTEYGKGQSWCIEINMDHPALTGRADLRVVTDAARIVAATDTDKAGEA